MNEIFRSWFSNPRPLPLDKDGKVDFSLDSKPEEIARPDPKTAERFLGRMFDAITLPNGHRIILLYRWDASDPPLSLENTNHNVFRLDQDNKVVWQVRRVENPTHASWEDLHRMAKEEDPHCEWLL